jgi:hypothetical protein
MDESLMFTKIKIGLFFTILAISNSCAWSQANGKSAVTRSGDLLQVVLPLVAYGSTWYLNDLEGAKQYTQALALTLASTELLKASVGEWRPDHSDKKSFP